MAKTPRYRPVEPTAADVLTASSQILTGVGREQYALQYKTWQDELWAYLDTIGEFGSVMNWFAAGMGRMHLRAAVWKPDSKTPEFLDEGPAADLVAELTTHCKGGEMQFLRSWAKHVAVPGVGYLVMRETEIGREYDVKSADVVKRTGRTIPNPNTPNGEPMHIFAIRTAPSIWEDLDPRKSFVGRIFDPDPRYDYEPTSMTKGSLTTLREIDLINRAIIATLLSRVAFNGFLLIPSEVTFPVNEIFKEAPDPFIAELLEYAKRGIKDPGSPGAAIPFPLRIPAQFIDKFVHLVIANGIDPKIIEARTSAVLRLSEQLPAPPEAMSGISDLNHWNAATQTEENVKMYFAPPMELLVGGFTEVWLRPMLKTMKEPLVDADGNPIIVWYDASDLTKDPDNSENATTGVEHILIKPESWRETAGFADTDKPNDEEAREMILRALAVKGTPVPDSYLLLYPKDKEAVEALKPPPAPVMTPGAGGATGGNVGPSAVKKATPAPGKATTEPVKAPRE